MKFAIKFSKSKEHDSFKIKVKDSYSGIGFMHKASKETFLMERLVNINVVQRYGLVAFIRLY